MSTVSPIYEKIKAFDDVDILTACFKPDTLPVGVVQIVHGFGEGIIHYVDLAGFFTGLGYVCIVHDQRGHGEMCGLSQKQKLAARGISPGYEFFLHDIKTVRTMINHKFPNLPVLLYGHSMGGNIAINYLVKRSQNEFAKLILEAPWLRLYKPVPRTMQALAKLLGKISFNLAIISKLNKEHICRNAEKIKSLESDGSYHNRISFRLVSEISEAGEFAIKNASIISIPTLLLCPVMDKIVCPNSIREFARSANSNIKTIEYPDGYHALRNDSISEVVLRDIRDFVEQYIP